MKWVAVGAMAALLAIVLFLLALTQPRFGTPFANWALGVWGPEGSSVEWAWLKFPAVTTAAGEGLEMPGRLTAATVEARANPFGFLPGISWVSRLEGRDGVLLVGERDDGSDRRKKRLSDYRAMIDQLAVQNVEVRLTRADGERVIEVADAHGSLRSGALAIEASGAGSAMSFDGKSSNSLGAINGALRVSGDNFANLADLVGLAAPDTPPYDVLMDIDLSDGAWRFDVRPETRIGDSDVAGPVNVTLGGETPVIEADLVSRTLDGDDLGIVFGIPIGVGENETVGTTQTRAREAYDRSDRLIPDVEIDFARLDAVDGRISYRAEAVEDTVFDVTGLELDFEIDGRVVRTPLIKLDFEQGSLDAYMTIDGSRSPAVTTAEGNLRSVAIANLALDPYLRGTAEGRFKVEATGNGFRDSASTLDGKVSIWSTDADIMALAVEGAGLDLGEALTVLGESPDDRTYADTRCLAAVLTFEQGIGALFPAVVDTDDSVVLLRGDVNLATEALDLDVRSDAKDVSFGTLIGDVRIEGTLRNPQLQALSGETLAQVTVAALLGSLSGGLGALPFIEPGMAKDAPCAQLLGYAETVTDNSSASD